jgi:hypothetical protein
MKNVVVCADRTGDQIQAMWKHWEAAVSDIASIDCLPWNCVPR